MKTGRPALPHRVRATCCPTKWAVFGTQCKDCGDPRTLVLTQRNDVVPTECPRCHAHPPGWQMGTDTCRCFYCGQTWDRPWFVTGP
jgi:hypothetical protein